MAVELSKDLNDTLATTLNIELFQEAVEYALKDCAFVEICKVRVELGSRTGENYLGVIYRVKVEFQRTNGISPSSKNIETISLIVKCIPNSEASEFLHDSNVFLKEKLCYREVLPRMELLSKGKEKFGAKLFHSRREPIRTLLFEDLNTLNYRIASREKGLDEAHAIVVLKKLAQFHAMSILLEEKDPTIMHCFHSGLISSLVLKENGLPLQYYGAEIATLEAVVRQWQGFTEIADKIARYRSNFRDNLLRSMTSHVDDIRVLNHGDFWVNNILFKYNTSGEPMDAVFVDYQMSLWGSLGFDLNYFFSTSVQLEVLKTCRLHLLHVYYMSLSSTLSAHDYNDIPSFEAIQREVHRRGAWSFFATFAIMPLVLLDKNAAQDNNLDNMANEDFALKKMQHMFNSANVQEMLKYNLKRLDELGVLDW